MGLADIKLLVLNVNLLPKDRTETNLSDRLIRKQGSMFLHGASGVGKTTMLERTTGKSPEELKEVVHTIGGETHLVGGKSEDPTMVMDYGGDQVFADERLRSLNELRPLAILMLLDHAPRGYEYDPVYKCPPKGNLPRDEGDPIRVRYEQHMKAISELRRILFVSPSVAEQCRIVLPIVNKRDAWEAQGYTLHIFTDWYFDALQELNTVLIHNRITWHRPVGVTGKYEGFGDALNIVNKHSGKEMVVRLADNPFINITLRFPTSRKM